MRPDRIVLGCESERSEEILRQLYAPFNRNHDKIIVMDSRSAEMTKYAANTMLATKISLMNEISVLCDLYGANVEFVRSGIGSDSRIGFSFIYPGVGFGGSCFPKDLQALQAMANDADFNAVVVNAVIERNKAQKEYFNAKFENFYSNKERPKKATVWGLSFKPETDDMREAPSLELIQFLVANDIEVQCFDPVANANAKLALTARGIALDKVRFYDNEYAAAKGAECLFIVTEWKPFRNVDFASLKDAMTSPVIFDGRNLYDNKYMKLTGFDYISIGRPSVISH
jgi:UDPglucose 6-dehydrogenase